MSNEKKKIDENKKNYVFFNNPDIIVKRAELSVIKNQQQKNYNSQKECNNFHLFNEPLQPYPFTFISALRRKLTLEAQHETEERNLNNILESKVNNFDQKMDFIKPLKIPDLKISPKPGDFSPRDNLQRNASSNKLAGDIVEKNFKGSERVNRKLDFLSSQSSLVNEDMKQLKAPDVSFTSSFSRKKTEQRDYSRDKGNKMKRIKKDEEEKSKDDESYDSLKKRNSKHIPRRDSVDSLAVKLTGKSSSNRSHSMQKDKKSFALMAGKNDEKKSRVCQSKALRDRSVEMKGKVTSSESISDRNSKAHDYITLRNELRASNEHPNQSINELRQLEDHKYRIGSDNKVLKHQMMVKEPHKRVSDKLKTSKIHQRSIGTFADVPRLEDIGVGTKSDSIYTDLSLTSNKSKEEQGTLANTQQNLTSSDINSLNDKNSDITKSSDEIFLDSKKISFRDDNYSQQQEFCNLVTPDLSLVYRPKRKKDQRSIKSFQATTIDDGPNHLTSPKYKSYQNDKKEEDVPLLHPTALHMQFQAELHLFDSYNESIRQVTDVENSLFNVKQNEAREKLQMQKSMTDPSEKLVPQILDKIDESKLQEGTGNDNDEKHKPSTKVEVQTQTANDIATQTDTIFTRNTEIISPALQHPGITYRRGSIDLRSIDLEDIDQLEEISLPNKIRAMSEISLHETTSSIKTETGTEISISTRDVTYSFNKFLDLEMAQLIKDERQTNDKIEMLFRSHEKTLYDRTRKLVKLEEQKRALRDTGQDSRISSVKKKQRALLLKLQQEKEEMNRLKELHKKASQERKLMLQKQRNMLNPQMSTKNFLTKLKRSADCQSPRRLSGPMKGYDIRSNSSISSLIDSDKSQIDKSNLDEKLDISDSSVGKINEKLIKCDGDSLTIMNAARNNKYSQPFEESSNSSRHESPEKYQLNTRKFEEKMPKSDLLRLKAHHMDLESKLQQARQSSPTKSSNISSDVKSESDTLVEELSKKSKARDKSEEIKKNEKSTIERDILKKAQYNQELKLNKRKTGKHPKLKTPVSILTENILKSKLNANSDDGKNNKKTKVDRDFLTTEDSYQSILEEINLNDSQNSLQALVKHSRAVKAKNNKLLQDIAHEYEAKENISDQMFEKDLDNRNNVKVRENKNDVQNQGNISTRSQVSTFTISRHSSGDSEKSYSRSVVIRSQQDHQFKLSKKLEQVLHAREAALASRRNCVEDWIAWHAKLKAEESRIIRMEEAALKLVSANSNVLSCNDTTMSSDTSDVEDRVELLVEKLAHRRAEMAKLKKEARKQAKQRLKTLEANLLNQIKKYDITINEMRKKLDQKRNFIEENGKLAIEAKSVADIRVPEIPIKSIQDLYKSNDLSRSRSESDLITNNIYSLSKNNDKKDDYESTSSLISKNSSKTEDKGKTTNRSIESVLEEARRTLSSRNSKISLPTNDNESDKRQELSEKSSKIDKKSVEIEENKSNSDTNKSVENSTIYSKIEDKSSTFDLKFDKKSSEKSTSSITEEEINDVSSNLFPNKIDLLHLNNQNLTDDINTLENDLKTLSEMVSRFNKKTDDKSVSLQNYTTVETEKSTVKDISVELSQSDVIEMFSNQSKKLQTDEQSEEISIINDEWVKTSETCNESIKTVNSNTEIQSEAITTTIPSQSQCFNSKLSDEIDFQAKSKAILNVVEQSIISEHVKLTENNFELSGAALEKSMLNLHRDNETLSSDFNSLEGDIKSISKIISQITGNKQSLVDTDCPKSFNRYSDKLSKDLEISKNFENKLDSNEISEEIDKIDTSDKFSNKDIEEYEEISKNLENEKYSNKDVGEYAEATKDEFSFENVEKSDESNSKNATEMNESESKSEELGIDENLITDDFEKAISVDRSKHESSYSSQKPNKSSKELTYQSSFDYYSNEEDEKEIENEVEDQSESKISPNWTVSNSFKAVPNEINASYNKEKDQEDDHKNEDETEKNNTIDIQVSFFIPKGESTNIHELYGIHSDVSLETNEIDKKEEENIVTDELDDIIDIIERDREESLVHTIQHEIIPNELKLQKETDNNFVVAKNNDLNFTTDVEPELQKITEVLTNVENNIAKRTQYKNLQQQFERRSLENKEIFEGMQENQKLDNQFSTSDFDKTKNDEILILNDEEIKNKWTNGHACNENDRNQSFILEINHLDDRNMENHEIFNEMSISKEIKVNSGSVSNIIEIIKDSEYEDISEESMEILEIFDKSKHESQKPDKIAERYEPIQHSNAVLRILDTISQQSLLKKSFESQVNKNSQLEVKEDISKNIDVLNTSEDTMENVDAITEELNTSNDHLELKVFQNPLMFNKNDKCFEKDEISSEINEDVDTPGSVSDINLDSPRDQNESRLDTDSLNDDLLVENRNNRNKKSLKTETQSGGISTTEKDIELMIAKLRASLDQPGLEVVELDARLLRIEQLQIELEIKKLEAEEKSFFVREIPNKPPPPYTPPGIGGLSPESLSSLIPSIVPTNVEDLTIFTEKATIVIFNAKQLGKDIMNLETPSEIYEFNKDNNEIAKKDRKIYNTFLFDLCKETIVEVYQGEYENPGPSWTKPNFKTKPAIKIPRTIDELNEYVSKEVATLFGFKTKLQRENMVMRWSRKRRDRVDELLAREAQAEEDEWTKFHHDELAVKNELTVAILDTLLLESANVIKDVYTKKRRIMV